MNVSVHFVNAFRLMTLAMLSTPVMVHAQYYPPSTPGYWEDSNDRFERRGLNHQFRDEFLRRDLGDYVQRMDVCQDVKENLMKAEQDFSQHAEKLSRLGQQSSSLLTQIDNKKSQINRRKSAVHSAQEQVAWLDDLNQNKESQTTFHRNKLEQLTPQIKSAQNNLTQRERDRNNDCKGLGLGAACSKAKRQLDIAKKELVDLNQQKEKSLSLLDTIKNIAHHMSEAAKTLKAAQFNLSQELQASPTIEELEAKFQKVDSSRMQFAQSISGVRFHYGQTALRAENCEIMKFEARKNKVFKMGTTKLVKQEQSCDEILELLKSGRVRGFAAREALNEVYDLFCQF